MAVTDLEMTRLCAKAMGWIYMPAGSLDDLGWRASHYKCDGTVVEWEYNWKPLHDDAQAMALVKKLGLGIEQYPSDTKSGSRVYFAGRWADGIKFDGSNNLNRAIVECVAKMEAAK